MRLTTYGALKEVKRWLEFGKDLDLAIAWTNSRDRRRDRVQRDVVAGRIMRAWESISGGPAGQWLGSVNDPMASVREAIAAEERGAL